MKSLNSNIFSITASVYPVSYVEFDSIENDANDI